MAQSHTFRPVIGVDVTNQDGDTILNTGDERDLPVDSGEFSNMGTFLAIDNEILAASTTVGDTLTVTVGGVQTTTIITEIQADGLVITDFSAPLDLTTIEQISIDERTPTFDGATKQIEIDLYNDAGSTNTVTNSIVVTINDDDYAALPMAMKTSDILFLITEAP